MSILALERLQDNARAKTLIEEDGILNELTKKSTFYILFQVSLTNSYKQKSMNGKQSLYHITKKLSLVNNRARSLCSLVTYAKPLSTPFQIFHVDELNEPMPFYVNTRGKGNIIVDNDIRNKICKRCLRQLRGFERWKDKPIWIL